MIARYERSNASAPPNIPRPWMLLLPIFIGMLLPAAATYFARLTGPVQGKLLMLLRSGARAHTPAEAGVTRLVPVQTGDLGNRQSIVLPTVCTGLGLGKQTNKNTTRESNPTDVKITKGHDYPKGKTALPRHSPRSGTIVSRSWGRKAFCYRLFYVLFLPPRWCSR